MPTSEKPRQKPEAVFFYWDKDGRRDDANLHNPILDAGDHTTAFAVSRAVAKRIGLTDEEIDSIMGDSKVEKGHFIQDPTTGLLQGSEPGGGQGESDSRDDGGGKGDHPGPGYTKGAYVDKHGVIQTKNVYDAQRALFENRKVELDQPAKLSILIGRLGAVSDKMIKQGKDAPNFNLCNVTVKGTSLFCADTKGIPRVEMPQLDKQQTKDFQKYLKDQGYKVSKEKDFASHLHATQNELNGAKVAAGAQKIKDNDGEVKRIIVSKDNYILDGHHAWAAKLGLDAADGNLENDMKMKVSRVNISITKLLAEADKFTGGKGHKDATESKSVGQVLGEFVSRIYGDD